MVKPKLKNLRKISRLCEISDKTEYLTLLEELDGPLSNEYLNLMTEPIRSAEEIA